MYTKIYIFLLVSLLCTAFAQNAEKANLPNSKVGFAVADTAMQTGNAEDEVNIDSLVTAQIAIARAKKWENYIEPVKTNTGLATLQKIQLERKNNWLMNLSSIVGMDKETTTKAAIILFSSLVAFVILVVRRLKLRTKSKTKNGTENLRSNIQSIRLEKSISKKETKLKVIRKNLLNSSVNLNVTEGSLARKAKELKIAKGEIILAAKIKSYELSICSSER